MTHTLYGRRLALFVCIALSTLLLAACATVPDAAITEGAPTASAVNKPPKQVATTADRPFTVETLYALLVAEMAIHRNRYDIALSNYVQQALSTNDILVASRATQIARNLNARQSALEMSQLWLDLDPANPDARQIALIELIEANHLLDAFELAKKILANGGSTSFESIAIKAEKGDIKVVNKLITRYDTLLKTVSDDLGLWLGQSILSMQAGQLDAALHAAEKAKAIDENPIRSAFQETRVLHKMGKTELASKRLAQLVSNHPENIGLRARYARLMWSSSPELAHEQFKILHGQTPADAEILYSLALIEKDLGLMDAAKTRFNMLIKRNQYTSSARFHLGEIYQNTNQLDLALNEFKQVEVGQNYIGAIVKVTDIMVGKNQRPEAITFVQEQRRSAEGSTLESLHLLEADIYSKAGQTSASEKILTAGIDTFPNSTRLLYARAMLYAQIDYVSAAELDLKRVLELVPENAAALNALGYTLADRTNRYQEAYEYIKQAYALTPDDPAVIDSMGWVAYRLGNYDEALRKLRRAMEAFPDHEIAAHLGEVLWVTGDRQSAIAIWKQGLELQPESKVIHKTLHRLEAKID